MTTTISFVKPILLGSSCFALLALSGCQTARSTPRSTEFRDGALLARTKWTEPTAEPLTESAPESAPAITASPWTEPGLAARVTGASVEASALDDGAVVAQSERSSTGYRPHAGDWEVMLGGSGLNDNEFDSGSAAVVGNVGYFVSDEFEIGLRQSVTFSDSGATGSEAWNGASRGFVDFHLPMETIVPFVGANFGYVYGDSVEETFAAAPEAGVKVFLKPETFVMAMAEYQFFFEDGDNIDDQFENGQFAYSIGFGILF